MEARGCSNRRDKLMNADEIVQIPLDEESSCCNVPFCRVKDLRPDNVPGTVELFLDGGRQERIYEHPDLFSREETDTAAGAFAALARRVIGLGENPHVVAIGDSPTLRTSETIALLFAPA